MTIVQTTFAYAWHPDARKLRAIDQIREVYGIRQFVMDERARMLQVEYDASRLTKDDVVAVFRDAGIKLWRLSMIAREVPSFMSPSNMSSPDARTTPREEQGAVLRSKEQELGRLADLRKREEFFQQILPLLQPLQDYVKRRLRVAYLDLEMRTPVETNGDILDRVLLKAYEDFRRKPADLNLEQWLYQLTDRVLQSYIQRRKRIDARRRSLETLRKTELRSLEEPITADAEGEPWLVEDLDDAEIDQREFKPPADTESDPEKELEREEEVDIVLRALSKVPERERAIFDLVMVEGFSEDVVSRMYWIPRGEVRQIVEKVREKIRREAAAVSQGNSEQRSGRQPAEKKAS